MINYGHIKVAFQRLEGILYGNDILVTELEELGIALIKGEAIGKWRKIWEGPDLITEWLKIFVGKLNNVVKWRQLTENGKLLGEELDLSEVYRPEIFLNALKQRIGRETKIPVNQLKIKSSFSKPAEISVKIKNLILQGCSLSRDAITETKHDQEYE